MNTFAFYRKVVALNSEQHRNLRFDSHEANFSFARDTISVLIAGQEFAEVTREYPIVFIRGSTGQMLPVVLLGVRDGENLFVDEKGSWDARYIPAFVRRYPFVMAEGDEPGKLVVCIDENCPALNVDQGELLISAEGKLEPRMNDIMQFLQNFQQEFMRTEAVIKLLDEQGVFIDQTVRFDTAGGETFQLKDFFVIDQGRLGQLEDDKLILLFRSGAMELAHLHLASLGNMRKLLDRLATRAASQKQTPKDDAKPLLH